MAQINPTALQANPPANRPTEDAKQTQKLSTEAEASAAKAPNDAAAIRAAVQETDPKVVLGGRKVEFSFDSDNQQVIVKVTDPESGELVRQIPPEEFLNLSANLRELFGVIFDQKA